MSLFPAYAEKDNAQKQKITLEDRSWLSLSNCPADLRNPSHSSTNLESSTVQSHSHFPTKKKTRKRHRECVRNEVEESILNTDIRFKKEKTEKPPSSESKFKVDRKGSKNNSLIPSLMKTDTPSYRKPKKYFVFNSDEPKKKALKWRYFNTSIKYFENDGKVTKHSPNHTNEEFLSIGNVDVQPSSRVTECKISETVKSYNQELAEDPHNEELWFEFINYQDEMKRYVNQCRKPNEPSIPIVEKKLAILDRALTYNPLSEKLLLLKLDLLNEFDNLDKVSEELFSALRQDFGNLRLWNRYIQVVQYTVSRCSVSKVISLYAKAIEKVNFIQKYGVVITEMQLIELFFRCALFLRQAGLWEQLCTLIRLNLELNLPDLSTDNFKVNVQVAESRIKQLEDEILACGLPIYSLWLRIEKIRQRVHWYPVTDVHCEDPQRVVVPTDVVDLIRPITTQFLSLRFAVLTMQLLKVPLIPLRDCIFRILGLDEIPWYLDSAEVLLSAFGSTSILQRRFRKFDETVVSCLRDLVSYPQYVNDDLGRAEFLGFVESMFKKISQRLPLDAEIIMLIWWLRFERCLLVTGEQPITRKKLLKSSIKELLKEERHRNSLPLFIEYALLEKELTQSDEACLKILDTALLMHPINKNSFFTSSLNKDLTYLYRITSEVLLLCNHRKRCMKLLISLALAQPEKEITLDEITIKTALEKYQRVTNEIMAEDFSDELDLHHLRPQFFVEWIICEAWFLFLTENVWSACTFLEELLRKLPSREKGNRMSLATYHRELITEALITILHRQCVTNKSSYKLLNDILLKSIEEFPNNMLLLCTLSYFETKMNFVSPWWKIEKCLKSNDSVIAKLIMILLCRKRLIAHEQAHIAALGVLGEIKISSKTVGYCNRMRSLLVKLTANKLTRRCPLVWMIYLQYCAQYEDDEKFKDVFHMAIENCPWVKSLYTEGAQTLLDQVSQVQDLMVEKELRIHITQDEIDILRDS